MRKNLLLTAIIIAVCFGNSFGQIWKKSTDKANGKQLLTIKKAPSSFEVFELDLQSFKKELQKAPVRGQSSKSGKIELSFPNADGGLDLYLVMEAPIFHPDLAAKYPGIKSYVGQGVDNAHATIRFSVSEQRGFHGMVLSSEKGAMFIDPYSTDKTCYMVYLKSKLDEKFRDLNCLTENLKNKDIDGHEKATDDSKLRQYRLALSCNAEYGNIFAGSGTDAQKTANILSQMNITMTRVNGVYERDLAITMEIVANNDDIIYFGSTSSDPWSGEYNSKTQQVIDAAIGSSNYDIGHNFNTSGGGNAGCIGCVCSSGEKGSGYTGRSDPTGDAFDIDYVAHEMGHQFGGYHTMNTCYRSGSGSSEVEPASGSSIMGYAGICSYNVQSNSDAYFAYVNIKEISENVQTGTSSGCPTEVNLSNSAPTANAGSNYTIPKSTAFVLTGQGTDADGDALTYTWAQNDPEQAPGSGTPQSTWTSGPLFRAKEGTTAQERYFPQMSDIVAGDLSPTWEVIPSVSRSMEFSLTVRDNHAGGGQTADDLVAITVDGSAGPFLVTAPNTNVSWSAGTSQTVTWDVASTNSSPVSCATVNILLSSDGGYTYPVTLAAATSNDGSETITVPNNQGSSCRIMVIANDNIFFDISNTDFTISGVVVCTATVPTGLAASSVGSTTATLSWNAVAGADYDYRYREVGASSWTTVNTTGTSVGLTELTAETDYEAQVRSNCPSESSSYSSSVTFSTGSIPSCSGITSFPYSESFESGTGVWIQSSSDDIDWTRNSGGTPTGKTGPSSADDGSYYLYTEASTSGVGYPNKTAILTSPCIDLTGQTNTKFDFSYHMYGRKMGSLAVEVSLDGASWSSIWSESGNLGNSWETASISLTSYEGNVIYLRFTGETGTRERSDMAIDKLSISSGIITDCTDVTLTLVVDNYPEETSWTITNDGSSTVASGGTYNSTPDGSTVIETACLDAGCYTFTMNDSYGDGICCSYGSGSYELTEDGSGTSLASGGSFGSTATHSFCVGTSKGESTSRGIITESVFQGIKLHPNPVINELNVVLAKGTIKSMKIYSATGALLETVKINENTLDVSQLSSGVYILSVNTGQEIHTQKFIK